MATVLLRERDGITMSDFYSLKSLIGSSLKRRSDWRSLILELTRREFTNIYQGSLGGVFWSFIQPLFVLSVYTVTFGYILKIGGSKGGDTKDFAFMLFAGLLVYNAFNECLIRAPRLILANPNYVKKIVFPLEVLAWIPSLLAVINALIGWIVWIIGHALVFGMVHWSSLYFPLLLLVFLPVLLGIGWLFSSCGVILRDMSQFTALLSHALLFITPIFFSLNDVPLQLKSIMLLNPLTFIIGQARLVLLSGVAPDFVALGLYFLASCVFCAFSLWVFRRMRPVFADVL